MNIVFIHGHRATAKSFNFIRTRFNGHNQIFLEYDSRNGFNHNHQKMLRKLQQVHDIFFVAHSLGGLHALHLANELPDKVLGAVTMSTPYGGSELAEFLLYLVPFDPVLQDIRPHGIPIMASKSFRMMKPWTNIVTVKGHSAFMVAPNDGVVTIDSMRYRDDMKLVEVESNHYEVLLSDEAVAIINNAITRLDQVHRRESRQRIHA